MSSNHKIFSTLILLSDSIPLFPKAGGKHVMGLVESSINSAAPRAAYIGAANGDDRRYYEVFCAAFAYINGIECRQIPSNFGHTDLAYLETCDVVLLAGGSIERGWVTIGKPEVRSRLLDLHLAGKTLIGVSAGAIHLSQFVYKKIKKNISLCPALSLAPYVVSVHDETTDWSELHAVMKASKYAQSGIGLGHKSGLIFHQGILYHFGHVVTIDAQTRQCRELVVTECTHQLYH